jgi:hypothetical protein
MHNIRDLARERPGIAAARLRRPLTATLLAAGLMVALSASAVAKTAASASGQPATSPLAFRSRRGSPTSLAG